MPATQSQVFLQVFQTFAWDGHGQRAESWSWRIVAPGKWQVRPPGDRTYGAKRGAAGAARRAARSLGIVLET